MDYSIFIIIVLIGFSMAIVFGIKYLKLKNIISNQDIEMISSMFGLSLLLIDELNLAKERQIKQIGEIVIRAVEFGYDSGNVQDYDFLKSLAYEYILENMKILKLELTDNRAKIIDNLLSIAIMRVIKQ
jgi:hypothetical protein